MAETRQGPLYALIVSRSGPKIKEISEIEPGINTSKFGHEGHMKGTKERLSILASNFANSFSKW